MNLLIDIPPESVKIGKREYAINADFRTSILFELLMSDDEVDVPAKLIQAVDLYFEEYPGQESIEDVIKAIMWFYGCGRSDKEQILQKPKKKASQGDIEADKQQDDDPEEHQRAYSFDYDDEYIYAAFRQQYGIDLAEVKFLHWWKFRAMFKSLDSECQFVKIMGYRTTKITKNMSKTEKEYIRKMKKIHALPVSEKEWKEQNALAEALMNGGDLTGLL